MRLSPAFQTALHKPLQDSALAWRALMSRPFRAHPASADGVSSFVPRLQEPLTASFE